MIAATFCASSLRTEAGMIVWPGKALVQAIHDRQLAEHGGASGVRDETLLESALAKPQQLFAYGDPPPDLADLAASLAFGLARNHPFVDGNKRTATVCCELLIRLNGARLDATDADMFPVFLRMAEGLLSQMQLADWLRERIVSTPQGQVQEAAAAYRSRA